ncbi:MAG: aminotransferase, partial [Clostridia bacterium]|nr:aminotransferase [Clostridia bacterium]
MDFSKMKQEELSALLDDLRKQYAAYQNKNLSLDLSRGKPGAKQLDLLQGMLDCISSSSDCRTIDGFDCRNYGLLDGITGAKKMFSELLG